MAKAAKKKPGRKPGQKVGPYRTINFKKMYQELKDLQKQVKKLEKVLG